eukprot:2829591-Rhodomonas_salina.1
MPYLSTAYRIANRRTPSLSQYCTAGSIRYASTAQLDRLVPARAGQSRGPKQAIAPHAWYKHTGPQYHNSQSAIREVCTTRDVSTTPSVAPYDGLAPRMPSLRQYNNRRTSIGYTSTSKSISVLGMESGDREGGYQAGMSGSSLSRGTAIRLVAPYPSSVLCTVVGS